MFHRKKYMLVIFGLDLEYKTEYSIYQKGVDLHMTYLIMCHFKGFNNSAPLITTNPENFNIQVLYPNSLYVLNFSLQQWFQTVISPKTLHNTIK